jgi:hypothetical protein
VSREHWESGPGPEPAPRAGKKKTLATLLGSTKSSLATRLVEMAHATFTLGVTATGETFAVPIDGPNVARVLRGGQRSVRTELARLHFAETRTTANAQALADAILVLEGESQRCEPTETALRVGRSDDGQLVLDLGRDDGQAVLITAYGWEVAPAPVLLWRTNATLPLPIPVADGNLAELRDLLNVSDEAWPLIVAWLVAALMPNMPHPVLLLHGEHGTAKSSAARLLTSLIDRCASQPRTAPQDVEDWCVAAAASWVTCLDNVSDIRPWLSDAICRAVTGDGLLRRQLYTDSDVSVLAFKRVIALTSVDPGRLAGDLADRLLDVGLERIPEDQRASEEDLAATWAKAHPAALGGLLNVAVSVLQELPTVRRTNLPRMADFARVLLAVDRVLGTSGYATYADLARAVNEAVVDSDSVAVAIRERIRIQPWEGTASELLRLLTPEKPPKDWPTTPQGMGGRLKRVAPALRAVGWTIEKLLREPGKGTRGWTIAPPATENEPPPADGVAATSSRTSPSSRQRADQRLFDDNQPDDPAPRDDPNVTGGRERHDVSAGQAVSDNGDDIAATPSAGARLCSDCAAPLTIHEGTVYCPQCWRSVGEATP